MQLCAEGAEIFWILTLKIPKNYKITSTKLLIQGAWPMRPEYVNYTSLGLLHMLVAVLILTMNDDL